MSARRARLWRVSALALACGACVELPDFERRSEVTGPRVLALVAEPPEARPGQDVALSLLLVEAQDFTVRWRACAGFDGFGGAQYETEPDEGCGGGTALPLGEGATATLSGAVSQALWENLALAEVILGNALPRGTIERVRTSVGLPFLVEADVMADGRRIRAVKRVLISERSDPHVNPPPPRFALGELAISAVPGEPFACAAEGGERPVLAPGEQLELVPEVGGDGEQEPWLERYSVLDLRGELTERDEVAFYSWFSTGGRLSEEITKSPLRNELWRTPASAGCHRLWLVVRDGHGGTSACGVDVTVGDADCE
jgi:hypothetical protein